MNNQEDTKNEYSRTEYLREKFNKFWNNFFGKKEDYFQRFRAHDFVNLKKVTHNIDNIITLLVTKRFVACLCEKRLITATQEIQMQKEIDKQHPNANGYDVEFPIIDDHKENVKIIAEVKCNLIPDGKKHFDQACQTSGIINDLKNLADGKEKSKLKGGKYNDYYKFMVLLDGDSVSEGIEKIIAKVDKNKDDKYESLKGKLINGWPSTTSDISTEKIYIVTIPLES